MKDCLFCKLANDTSNLVVLWEDRDLIAFLDICPIREGHTQIIPKEHFEYFETLPSELSKKILDIGQQLAKRLKKIYKIDRIAFLFTGGDVPHVHAHIVPMHEKTDITSERYILNANTLEYGSDHLETDIVELSRVKEYIDFKAIK